MALEESSILDGGKVRSTDARALRSRMALREAFLALVLEKSFEQITIREITERAGLSYPTFFRNFASKEDLLGTIATREVWQLLELMGSTIVQEGPEQSAKAVCNHVSERRTVWRALVTSGAASKVREELVSLTRAYSERHGRFNPEIPLEMVSSMVAGGLFELLAWWLRQPDDYPVENVALFLQLLLLVPTTTRYDLSLLKQREAPD